MEICNKAINRIGYDINKNVNASSYGIYYSSEEHFPNGGELC